MGQYESKESSYGIQRILIKLQITSSGLKICPREMK